MLGPSFHRDNIYFDQTQWNINFHIVTFKHYFPFWFCLRVFFAIILFVSFLWIRFAFPIGKWISNLFKLIIAVIPSDELYCFLVGKGNWACACICVLCACNIRIVYLRFSTHKFCDSMLQISGEVNPRSHKNPYICRAPCSWFPLKWALIPTLNQ